VHKFTADGKLIKSWGGPGSGPGEFNLPHGAWIDSKGRLRPSKEASQQYQKTYRKALNQHHRRCRMVSLALRSPFLVTTAVRAACRFPAVAGSIARKITGNS
jgi:hypothetical protein